MHLESEHIPCSNCMYKWGSGLSGDHTTVAQGSLVIAGNKTSGRVSGDMTQSRVTEDIPEAPRASLVTSIQSPKCSSCVQGIPVLFDPMMDHLLPGRLMAS